MNTNIQDTDGIQIKMPLKVLYTIDNESNSFLTRAKTLLPVRVQVVPSPVSTGNGLRIGIIDSGYVLEQIYQSSPELFQNYNNIHSKLDYNVYFKDICELNEPFVSFGLLSELRVRQINNRRNEDDEESNEEDLSFVIGRICTNFASLLKRSRSDINKENSNEILEVKIRFSKVVTRANSNRSSISNISELSSLNKKTSPNSVMKKPTLSNSVKSSISKRETNPMPAVKAFRTQSLPIWNNGKAFILPRNSIAHKIYMADRNKEQLQLPSTPKDKRPMYQITSLQNDSSITKFKVDDDVSKRFDFMKKNKGKKIITSTSLTKKIQKKNLKHNNTTSILPSNLLPIQLSIPKYSNPSLQEILSPNNIENKDLLELNITGNKENVPPQLPSECSSSDTTPNLDELFQIDFTKDLITQDRNISDEWFRGLFNSPLKPSPKYVNTCNTLPIEEDSEDLTHKRERDGCDIHHQFSSDIDRTSPIDTLSMPFLELGSLPNRTMKLTSCEEQLKRMPLLSNRKKEEDIDEDATSIMQFSTPPGIQNEYVNKRLENVSDLDDDHITMKKCKTIPSSPTTMFQYINEQIDYEVNETSNNEFSSFRQRINESDSTPATQYESNDLLHDSSK